MLSYIIKRISMAVPTVFIVTLLVFGMIRALPGDPASLMLGDLNDPVLLQQMRHSFGLDHSIPAQFAIWVSHLLSGDFGMSIEPHQPVLELIREGLGFDQITRDHYPDLQPDDLRACVQYAIDVLAAEDIHLATA